MGNKDTFFPAIQKIRAGEKIIDFSRPKIMGILNLTPDSFFDGGKYIDGEQGLYHAEEMLKDGADMIDIGAVSTRPGAPEVDEEEEKRRLLPVLEKLVAHFPEALFSIDTFRSGVAKEAVETGAHIVNDISGGTMDTNMFSTIARLNVPYILMHIHGTPQTMQQHPVPRQTIVEKVSTFFSGRVQQLREQGVENIILDPGFGFGKTLEANYRLLAQLGDVRVGNLPILAGISRKSMINKVLQTQPEDALNGTTALHTLALLNGANILRVHDVKEAVEVVRLVEFYRNFGNSGNSY